MSQIPTRSIRLTGKSASYLDSLTGSAGELFYDTTNQTLRIFQGNSTVGKILTDRNWVTTAIAASTKSSLVNSTKTVSLSSDGALTLPIGVSIDSSVSPLYPKIIADSGKLFSVQGQGSTGSAAMAWSLNPNTDTQYAAVGVNKGGGDDLAKVVLTAGNTTATLKVWKFDQTGAFTFPDATVQTTAYTGVIDYNNLVNKPVVPLAYQFSVAADDSTQRVVNSKEVIKFIGAGSITTGSDAEGNITITGVPASTLTTVSTTGVAANLLGTGTVATVTTTPTNDIDLTPGSYPLKSVATGTGFTVNITVASNGDITATVANSGSGFAGGETGVISGLTIGGQSPRDNLTITVATLSNIVVPAAIDLTKSVNELTSGTYTLADGVQGQIMYLVPRTGASLSTITVTVANARVMYTGSNPAAVYVAKAWQPFVPTINGPTQNISTLIFTSGAWQANTGTWA